MSCVSDLDDPGNEWRPDSRDPAPCAWTDITYLLHEHGVSWGYDVGEETSIRLPCPKGDGRHTTATQVAIAGFRTVQQNGQPGTSARTRTSSTGPETARSRRCRGSFPTSERASTHPGTSGTARLGDSGR
jgi:hypothetical protein